MHAELYYQDKIAEATSQVKKLKATRNYITFTKIILFLLIIYFLYSLLTTGNLFALYTGILSIILFVYINYTETKLLQKITYYTELRHGAKIEVEYLAGDSTHLPKGDKFKDLSHAYSHDLDLFGENSLFQSVNRTVTPNGTQKLSEWLCSPLKSKERVLQRQQAVQELSEDPDWCHSFRAIGVSHKLSGIAIKEIREWSEEQLRLPTAMLQLSYYLPIVTIAGWSLCLFSIIPFSLPLLLSFIQLTIVLSSAKKINRVQHQLDQFIHSFSNLHRLMQHVRSKQVDSERLKEIYYKLYEQKYNAEEAFRSLHKTSESFDQRGNILAAILLNGLFMKDVHLIRRLTKWKEKYASFIPEWLESIGELDVFVSLANYRFNHPDYIFPIPDDEVILRGEAIGHPMLPASQRIVNDFQVARLHEFYIVTGANMAGKSTFLRTIGTNLILANCGCVVCAKTFRFQPIAIFSSMRTADNLAKGTSYFHAELLRLKQLVETAEKEDKLFIILDEILKGTNSVDKLNGSRLFIQKLLSLPVSGLIATHDLELGKLADVFPRHFINNCFEIAHSGTEISYDYKLKPGISQTMNASILLKKMGLV